MSIDKEIRNYVQGLREKGYAEGTVKRYLEALKWFSKQKKLTRDVVEKYPIGAEWTTRTIEGRLVTVRKFLKDRYPTLARYIDVPKVEKGLPKEIPSEMEVMEILQSPDTTSYQGIRDRVMLELLYGSGLRRSEAVNVRVEDVDIDKCLVRVNKGKNGKDRVVPISKMAAGWMRRYLDQVRASYKPKENALFIGKKGKGLNKTGANRIVKRYGKYSPHKYRHGYATHLLKGGMKETSLQRLLGHSRITTTQIYTKVTIQDVQQSYRRYHPRDKWG